ncbi:probable LRR receptor-like serine/threonine-protein kinase At1g56130 isoform X2 [Impatiens glandulifera]|uniref:probable LRR receptor-like serine/threonine-protein kinase At1g56130 isoform X2 n=1 Tax=Impatiens glandulifera TaxID=253017 RepID=UPI001FB1270B|nr:probable LRR receptor-like serine/threonine-protein kinase At1g56130 isoform X2 [Impatiens glandulifera]
MARSSIIHDPLRLLFFFFLFFVFVFGIARAQSQTSNATTDPAEVAALNTIFQQWGVSFPGTSGPWNVSGNPCTGAAIDSVSLDGNGAYNPGIKCDCSFNNNSICHITRIRVYAVDAAGPIPDALWTLTFLTNLDIAQNILSGPISPAIGNLTRMQYMSLGINAFTGEIPKELGLLTDLRLLYFSSNKFSGPLPSTIGNLQKLEQLYMDSCGASGPIPASFAALQNLHTVWASDNNFTGNIPDFIGGWTKLTELRFQGNSFQGPIPSTFSKLTLMESLRISDLSTGSSQLTFIQNMTSLKTLILRNNNISGSIPSFMGGFLSLSTLDLSFNNLTGGIPEAVFNLSSLSFLYLGNNKLIGSVPSQKSQSLLNVDLSYNELSGSFPTWISDNNLQINLVANNFTIGSSDNIGLPSGLNCLQKNFPCGRNSPTYSSFAIKCGGPPITSSTGIQFERENENLGPATYFTTSTSRWAVSNAGRFAENNNPLVTAGSTSQFNSLDSELFQTARKSPGSLRYYGLGLENGNYTVSLQFAEIEISNEQSRWQSLGRRVFDIYIQGQLELKDFDIVKAAGGATRAHERKFTANVFENYLEIHFFWAGKGTCCIPAQGTYGPLISAISATPDFVPTVSNKPKSSKKNNTGLIAGVVVSVGVVILASLFALYFYIQRKKRLQNIDDEEFLGMETKPFMFSYSELRVATGDFSSTNKLGEGGFGPVFKGSLSDGRVVAVKQLSVASHQGKSQFVAEIVTISAVQHRNLVKLYGCCLEGEKRLLVYEFLENKSLDQALFGKAGFILDWPTRFDICLGVARGLTYLHEESRLRIVHRDVKASNILLDSNLSPKISDFGLAKLYDDMKTHISTRVAGTIGYLAPEYAMRGHLTEKADVFGFGVVALEIVAGRPNSDTSLDTDKMYLLEWAWNLHENNAEVELVDEKMSDFNEEEVKRLIGVALLCTQTSPTMRPSMSRVVAMLSGDIEVGSASSRPGYLTDWKFSDTTTFMSNDSDLKTGNNSHRTATSSSTDFGTSIERSPIGHQSSHDSITGEGR